MTLSVLESVISIYIEKMRQLLYEVSPLSVRIRAVFVDNKIRLLYNYRVLCIFGGLY